MSRGRWLPAGFVPPTATPVPYGHRLRPAAGGDLARLLVADEALDPVRGHRQLADWLDEMATGAAFTYVLVDADETAILGRVRVGPDGIRAHLVAECRGTGLAVAFAEVVERWVAEHWPGWVLPDPPLALSWSEC